MKTPSFGRIFVFNFNSEKEADAAIQLLQKEPSALFAEKNMRAQGNGYQFNAGTSMASPQVSGLASLLRGYNTNLANDNIRNILQLSADDVNANVLPGGDDQLGFGRIND